MPLFENEGDRVKLGDWSELEEFIPLSQAILQESHIPRGGPFQLLLFKFITRALVQPEAFVSPRWASFTFWSYSKRQRLSRLAYSRGIDLRANREFPRVVSDGEGIVGTLASSCRARNEIIPHVSLEYSNDALLRSRTLAENLGYRSGVAIPVFLTNRLGGILQLHFTAAMDKECALVHKDLRKFSECLSILLKLAQDHYSRLINILVSRTFRLHTSVPIESDRLTRRGQSVAATIRALEDLCKAIPSIGAQVFLFKSSTDEPVLLTQWLAAAGVAEPENTEKFDLREFGDKDAGIIGALHVLRKTNREYFSTCDRRLIGEFGRQLAANLSPLLTIEQVEEQSKKRSELIEQFFEVARELADELSIQRIVVVLETAVIAGFGFPFVKFHRDHASLRPGVAYVEATSKRLELLEDPKTHNQAIMITCHRKDLGYLELQGKNFSQLSVDEVFFFEMLCNLAGLVLWSREAMTEVERISREAAKFDIARDIVHSFQSMVPAIINSIDGINSTIEKIEKFAGSKQKIASHVSELKQRMRGFAETAILQENIIERYRKIQFTGSPGQADPTPVDLVEMQENIKAVFSFKAFEKDVEIEVRCQFKKLELSAFRNEIYLIFLNLIDNAVKFSRRNGRVFFEIDQDAENVTCRVRDFGVGIQLQNRARIWDIGYSTIAPGAKEPTSGLGLASVREAASRIAGVRVEFASQPDRYCEFRIEIPRSHFKKMEMTK